jgi:hypothetical protein
MKGKLDGGGRFFFEGGFESGVDAALCHRTPKGLAMCFGAGLLIYALW